MIYLIIAVFMAIATIMFCFYYYITDKIEKRLNSFRESQTYIQQRQPSYQYLDINICNFMHNTEKAVRSIKEDIANIQHGRQYKVSINGEDVWKLTKDGKPVFDAESIVEPLPLDRFRAESIAKEFGGEVHHLYTDDTTLNNN